jgi:hypothetical protein
MFGVAAASAAALAIVGAPGCSSSSASPCGTPTVNLAPFAVPLSVPAAADAAPAAGVTVTGTVTGAACGVQGVSVLAAAQATATLPNFASWSALVPLPLFQTLKSCPPDAGPRPEGGVWVTAQALVPDGDGGEVAVAGNGCVSLALPAQACAAAPTCPGTNGPMAAGVNCQLPTLPSPSGVVELFTDTFALGQPILWRSASGLVNIASTSTAVRTPSTAETDTCNTQCASGPCSGTASAFVVGVPGANAGLDSVTATLDGYPSPVASAAFAVQGPPKITAVGTTIGNSGSLLVAVQNPMTFIQTCSFALPPGVQIGLLVSSGPLPDDDSPNGDLVDAEVLEAGVSAVQQCQPDSGPGGEACVSVFRFTEAAPIFALSFVPGLVDATATADGLGSPKVIPIVCSDQFNQTSTASVTASWTFNADSGAADATIDSAVVDAGAGG